MSVATTAAPMYRTIEFAEPFSDDSCMARAIIELSQAARAADRDHLVGTWSQIGQALDHAEKAIAVARVRLAENLTAFRSLA